MGATLFHEHMSFRAGFLADWVRYSAETRLATRPPTPGSPPAAAPPPPSSPPAPPAPGAPNPAVMLDEPLMVEE